MAIERLYIENNYIPLSTGLNPSITKSITDLEEPEKRKATYSKSVSIPRSKEADKVFSQMFEVNIINKTFDVTAKADCLYTVDDEPIIDGYLQLKEIKVNDFNQITYEVTMFSGTADFWANIKDLYLTDLDLSDYDHSFTKEIQQLSWETSISVNAVLQPFSLGTGYVYALVDYGFSTDATNFPTSYVPCCIYAREYITRIISEAGFSYTSTFIDSDECKGLIIPSSPANYGLTTAEIEDREFVANTPEFLSNGTTKTANLTKNALGSNDQIIFTNDSVAPATDTGLNYDPVTGVFTVVNAGYYDLNVLVDLQVEFKPDTANNVKTRCEVDGYILMTHTPNGSAVETQINAVPFYITYDDSAGFISGTRTTQANPTYEERDYLRNKSWSVIGNPPLVGRPYAVPNRYHLVVNNMFLIAGDEIRVYHKTGVYSNNDSLGAPSLNTNFFVDNVGTWYTGNAKLMCDVGAFYTKCANTSMAEGNTLLMSKIIPKNIKQVDFLTSILKMFNLWVDVDPDNPWNLIIETRDTYLGTDVLNIHELIDRSKDINYFPMGSLDVNSFRYNYKEDKDFWNQNYQTSYNEVYGNRIIESTGEFFTQDKDTTLIFSPTPLVGLPNSDRVLPTIYQLTDLNVPKSTQHNIRILYYGGMKSCSLGWNHINYVQGWPYTALIDTYTEYPYAGHWDDPFNPTLDINFGLVKEVYYDDNLQDINPTDNNLVNAYHSKQLLEITDENSYIVQAYVHMRPSDFVRFTFDKAYYFDYAYFRLQKIDNYNPTSEETTLCTFLKINESSAFTPANLPATGSPDPWTPAVGAGGAVTFTETSPAKSTRTQQQPDQNNVVTKTAEVSGEGNTVWSGTKNVEIYGNYNTVESEAKNIKIQGDNNIIGAGLENVTLINTSNVTVTESDVTYINGKIKDYWVEKTSGFVVDDTVYGYYLDGSSTSVDMRLDNSESEFFVKCVDATNAVYVDAGTKTIDNVSSTFYLATNESIRVKYSVADDTYYIIN